MSSIRDLVEEFVGHLSEVVETQVVARARHTVEAALAGHPLSKVSGRLRAAALTITAAGVAGRKPRKKAPVQLCPVPGCKERAAPIFGMVCAKHKDVPKMKIRQYREERRAGKQGKPGKLAAKSSAKRSPAKARKASARKVAAASSKKRQLMKTKAKTKTKKKKKKIKTKAKALRAAAPPAAKVEVVQKPAQVRVGAASAKVKAKRPSPPREAPPATLVSPAPASVPAQA